MANDMGERGSDNIFSFDDGDDAKMSAAITAARNDYQVKWWWKYGQPRIDLIRADLLVDKGRIAPTIEQFMGLNDGKQLVTAEVFPYGVVAVDAYRVAIEMRRQVGR